jgi:ABC-type phosphate transport system ATPase subunit
MSGDDGFCKLQSVEAKNGKRILESMALDFPVNCVTAIMGPSGSGKQMQLFLPMYAIVSSSLIMFPLHRKDNSLVRDYGLDPKQYRRSR